MQPLVTLAKIVENIAGATCGMRVTYATGNTMSQPRNSVFEPTPVQEHFATDIHIDCQADYVRVTFLTSRPAFDGAEETGREVRAEVAVVIPASQAAAIGKSLIEADSETNFLRMAEPKGSG